MSHAREHDYPPVHVDLRRVGCPLEPDHVQRALRELVAKHALHEATMRKQLCDDVMYREFGAYECWKWLRLTADATTHGARENITLRIEAVDRSEAVRVTISVGPCPGADADRLFDLLRETIGLWGAQP